MSFFGHRLNKIKMSKPKNIYIFTYCKLRRSVCVSTLQNRLYILCLSGAQTHLHLHLHYYTLAKWPDNASIVERAHTSADPLVLFGPSLSVCLVSGPNGKANTLAKSVDKLGLLCASHRPGNNARLGTQGRATLNDVDVSSH